MHVHIEYIFKLCTYIDTYIHKITVTTMLPWHINFTVAM